MGEGTVEKFLKDLGLTGTEAEIYIFLAKHNILTCSEIARQMRKDRAQTLRILKSLQAKNLVESTLEVPTRYASVPFEQVIDLSIKAKKDEAKLMENARNELLNYWKRIGKTALEPSPERFSVVKGNRMIYAKIAQMISETKNQLSSISTVADLNRGIQFGLLEAVLHHPLKSKIQFRFLTELSGQNVNSVKSLLERTLKAKVNVKGRNSDLGLRLFPRMVIRDDEEILFFIKSRTATEESNDLCLWTNCTDLVRSFSVVFEDLWANSTDINDKIMEIETGKPTPRGSIASDARTARKTFDQVLGYAEKEIIITTSSEGLIECWKHNAVLKERFERGVSVKIMAPITNENLQAAQELSKCFAVRHVPTSYLEIIIVDGKHLFEASTSQESVSTPHFYTDDLEYVGKVKNMLNSLWRNASASSEITLESIKKPLMPTFVPLSEDESAWNRPDGAYQKMIYSVEAKPGIVTEKDVLNKIINAKKSEANWPKGPIRHYGSAGNAVIHPPESFNLPDMMFRVRHLNKESSFGAYDFLHVYLWLKTAKGYAYVPVAAVTDNPKSVEFDKAFLAGTPAAQNVQMVRKDDLQVRVHGNIFFAGWKKPIQLFPASYVLPPSCILLEGYGRLNTYVNEWTMPSGVKINVEVNSLHAFVTFFHPASKYSGPGTDGTIGRDIVATIYPP